MSITTDFKVKENKLIIEIPLREKRFNPYEEMATGNGYTGEMDAICGLITNDEWGNDELGFANLLDFDYKGKEDQVSDFFYHYNGEQEDFEKLCQELGLDIYYLKLPIKNEEKDNIKGQKI